MAKNTNESTDSTAKPAAGAAAAAPPAAATAAAPAESRPRKLFATRTIVHGDRIIRAGEELKGVPKDSLELLVQGGDAAESAPAPSQVKVNEVEMPPPPKEIPQARSGPAGDGRAASPASWASRRCGKRKEPTMANRSDNTQARDSSLIPPLDQDLPNVVLDDDDVHTVDLSPDVLGFVATLLLVRADGGPFQWGSDPEQGAGPWWDAGSVVSVPCGGATSMKFIRRNNGGDTVTLSIKALGSY